MASDLVTIVARSRETAGLSRRTASGSSSAIRAQNLQLVRTGDRGPQRQQFVEGRSKCIDVSPAIDERVLAQRLLGAHVPQRSRKITRERRARRCPNVSHPEIGHPEVTTPVEQQVGGLDIAVDDPLVVSVTQGLGRLHAQSSDRVE